MMRGAMLLGVAMALSAPGAQAGDALPSWRDGPAKQAIVAFVERTTTAGSPDFIAPGDRIEMFEGAGWAE